MLSELEVLPRVLSIGTANPPQTYSQEDLLRLFKVTDPKIAGIFSNSHIQNRHLYLPKPDETGRIPDESPLELAQKHKQGALEIGAEAILKALAPLSLTPQDVDYLVCVTSTGFLCPSLTAHFIQKLGFRQNTHRFDVVGMGCNAGLNALQPLTNFCGLNEGRIGLQLCVEICSAAYIFDMTIRSSVSAPVDD